MDESLSVTLNQNFWTVSEKGVGVCKGVGVWRPPGPLCSAHLAPRPAAGNGGECRWTRAAPADADHQAERSASGRHQPRYALQPFHRRAAPPIPPSRHSSLRQGAWRRHLPSGTGWGSALDVRGCWCGGASRAGPGGSTPAQQGSGGAAGPSSGSDEEDSRAAGWAATPVNPGATAQNMPLVRAAWPLPAGLRWETPLRPTAVGHSSLLQTQPFPALVLRSAAQRWTTLSIPPGKLEVPVVRSQTTGDSCPLLSGFWQQGPLVGMIGRCPTVDIVMNGRKVRGLTDTGSEVTTVTERWVAENLQNSDLLPMTQVTLKAANGLEIPYSGVVIVDLELLGQKCEGVPVLVSKANYPGACVRARAGGRVCVCVVLFILFHCGFFV